MADIEFWFSQLDGDLENCLPYAPANFTCKIEGNNEVIDMIALGNVNILKTPKLKTWRIESMFPAKGTGVIAWSRHNEYWTPTMWKDFFEEAINEKKILTFTVPTKDIDCMVSVENFETDVRAGEEKDLYFTLEIKEYKEIKVQSAKVEIIATQPQITPPAIDNPIIKPVVDAQMILVGNGYYNYMSPYRGRFRKCIYKAVPSSNPSAKPTDYEGWGQESYWRNSFRYKAAYDNKDGTYTIPTLIDLIQYFKGIKVNVVQNITLMAHNVELNDKGKKLKDKYQTIYASSFSDLPISLQTSATRFDSFKGRTKINQGGGAHPQTPYVVGKQEIAEWVYGLNGTPSITGGTNTQLTLDESMFEEDEYIKTQVDGDYYYVVLKEEVKVARVVNAEDVDILVYTSGTAKPRDYDTQRKTYKAGELEFYCYEKDLRTL